MKRRYLMLLLLSALLLLTRGCGGGPGADDTVAVERPPAIHPDYTDLVIPPNIAPLNFIIREPGGRYVVRIHAARGGDIRITGGGPTITIPPKRWHKLLQGNRGGKLYVDVSARRPDGTWQAFQTVTHRIAEEPIDSHLVYRRLKSAFSGYRWMAIRQRDLTSYRDTAIVDSSRLNVGCVNCHTFLNNDPDNFIVHRRASDGATLIVVRDGEVTNVESRAPVGTGKMGYSSWHPSGRFMTFSTNRLALVLHATRLDVRDVIDSNSAMANYEFESKTTHTHPVLARLEEMETFPAWSPDGRYLYYCNFPNLWLDGSKDPEHNYKENMYDLARIPYDPDADVWGEPEMLVRVAETGLSVTEPRPSPDGRWVLFCMSDYGNFPIHHPSSDLYMLNTATGAYRRLAINSDRMESWHSWSSNSRWIAFSSRRRDGVFTRTYFSYIDESGVAHKPFVMPLEDPAYDDSNVEVYHMPELITGPVRVGPREIDRAIRAIDSINVDGITSASPPAPRREELIEHGSGT